MTMRLSLLAILPLFPLLLSACGGESEPVPAAPPPVAAESFLAAYASAICDRAARCYAVASYLGPSCDDSVRQSFGDDVTAAIAGGRLGYDKVAAGACLAGLAETECRADQPSDATITACLVALSGKVATGKPCFGTFECAAGICPSVTGDTCPALCPEVAKSGAACSFLSGPDCDAREGLRCSGATCVVPAAKGGACIDNNGCESGSVCVNEVCGSLRPEGAGCSRDASCDKDMFCAGGDEGGICEARLPLGGACGKDPEDTGASLRHVQCADGLVCKGFELTNAGMTSAGVCAAPADLDGACAVEPEGLQLFGTGCRDGLVCNAGKCAKPPAPGEACGPHFVCRVSDAYCDAKTTLCTAHKASGEACTGNSECSGGYCGSKGTCTEFTTFCGP
jgi:hypothetical protein